MNELGMYPSNSTEVKRWEAERECASAKLDLARTKECCKLLISQCDPVYSLGIDRDKLKVLLSFIQHHDPDRLRRDCEEFLSRKMRV